MSRFHFFRTVLPVLLLTAGSGLSPAQTNGTTAAEKPQNPKISALGWEQSFGGSFLSNTRLSGNKPFSSMHTLSSSFYSHCDIPLGKKEGTKGFLFRPAIGATVQTFGLDRLLETNGERSEFVAFPSGREYSYSYLQEVFAALPVGLVYVTETDMHRRFYEFELGGTLGYLLYSETRNAAETPNSSLISYSTALKNLNSMQYGIFGKINSCKTARSGNAGFFYSLSGNYYCSNLFSKQNQTPTKSFSLQLGIGIFITQKGMR